MPFLKYIRELFTINVKEIVKKIYFLSVDYEKMANN